MAVVTKKSELIEQTLSNRKPFVTRFRSPLRETTVVTQLTSGDSINSVYLVCPIKTNDRLYDIRYMNEAAGTGCRADIGLYKLDHEGNPVAIDTGKEYADSLSIISANVNMKSAAFSRNYDNLGKTVWQETGLSKDPNELYYIGLKVANEDVGSDAKVVLSTILATA